MTTIRTIVLALALIGATSTAHAFEARVDVTAQGGANEITVTVVDVTPPGSGAWVGWALLRHRHGDCEDAVRLTDVLPFDASATARDDDPPTDLAYSYVATLVDADGNTGGSAGYGAVATLGGRQRPLARGHLISGGSFGGGMLIVCEGMCWLPPPMEIWGVVGVQGAPQELHDSIDTGQVFDVYGEIGYYFEGPYFATITEVVPTSCGATGSEAVSWSALRARVR